MASGPKDLSGMGNVEGLGLNLGFRVLGFQYINTVSCFGPQDFCRLGFSLQGLGCKVSSFGLGQGPSCERFLDLFLDSLLLFEDLGCDLFKCLCG